MIQNFNFKKLFVYDLANNHQGDVNHALRIIDEIGTISSNHNVKGVMKFQFRQLDTFLHPVLRNESENKHLTRFQSTRLETDEYKILLDKVNDKNLISMCTPFDEESVEVIKDLGFTLIKIASCSAMDWPLIESVALSGLPVIFSTGGISLKQIDDIVSFFTHRGVDFAIMHCVSVYPTPNEICNLSHINFLKNRYPGTVIGWSTHEDPDNLNAIQIALAKGADMFERHVGIETDNIKLNAYSSTPAQINNWLSSYKEAQTLCGEELRQPSPQEEINAIQSLQRGIFVRRSLEAGHELTRDDVYFAMPWSEGQIPSGNWKEGIVLKNKLSVDTALFKKDCIIPKSPDYQSLKSAVHEVKAMLNEARIALNSEFEVEYSHHYGIKNFLKTGAVLITCVNRGYCKKLIIQLPGQYHPMHLHDKKEESFQVLYGKLITTIDGHKRTLNPGELVTILPGVWHDFSTETGVIFEEISSTHINSDSIYKYPKINVMKREQRKTIVDHWGRFQING